MTCSFVRKREQQGSYHGIPEPDDVVRCYAQFLEDHPEAREEEVHPRQVGDWGQRGDIACREGCWEDAHPGSTQEAEGLTLQGRHRSRAHMA